MDFFIRIQDTKETINTMNGIALGMQGYKEDVDSVYLGDGDEFLDLKQKLKKASDQIETEIGNMISLQIALAQSIELYLQTENKLINNDQQKQEPDLIKSIIDGFSSNLKQDILFSAIQSSGGLISRLGGIINVGTAIAKNGGEYGFVIVNPSVISKTAKLIKTGNWISTGAKYGLPIVGGILDCVSQISGGEDANHAVAKATVHTLNGVAIGMAVGSIIPGAGTAAGAVVGLVIGTAITYAANSGFDYVYDHYIKDTVTDICEDVASGVGNAVDHIGDAVNDIGDAVGGFFDNLGTVFG